MGHTRKEKQEIYDKNPHCFWCGIKMNFHSHINGVPIPDDAVTVDHLYPLSDLRRQWYKKHHIPSPIILSCYKCNHKRDDLIVEDQLKKLNKTVNDIKQYYSINIIAYQSKYE